MKQFIKQITKAMAVVMLLALGSCEKELYEDKIYLSKVNIEKVSLKDYKSKDKINSNLLKAVSKIKSKNQNIEGKIIFDNVNGIYFDEEAGIKITKGDYESYTFNIIKDGGKLENLLFIKNKLNEFDAYKAKYAFTEEEMKNISLTELQQSQVTYTNINSKVAFLDVICVEILSYVDDGELHGADTPPNYVWVVSDTFCGWVGNDGGSGGENSGIGNNGPSGGEGGGSALPGTSIFTTPLGTHLTPSEKKFLEYIFGLNQDQQDFIEDTNNSIVKNAIKAYLVQNNYSPESVSNANEIINLCQNLTVDNSNWIGQHIETAKAIINYLNQNGNTEETIIEINQTINSIINNQDIQIPIKKGLVPPSCEAFEFSSLGTANWQVAATKNIVALIGFYDVATGEFNTANVIFPQPIYFGIPKNSPGNGGIISGGKASKLTAKALNTAIQRAKLYFLTTQASSSQVQAKLWDYIRDEMANGTHVKGGSASFTPPNGYTGGVKDYEAYWFFEDDCE